MRFQPTDVSFDQNMIKQANNAIRKVELEIERKLRQSDLDLISFLDIAFSDLSFSNSHSYDT